MNKYDDEATRFENTDSESTRIEESPAKPTAAEETAPAGKEEVKAAKGGKWRRMAAATGTGVLIGALGSTLMGMKPADADTDSQDGNVEGKTSKDELSNPDWVDDEIPVATAVNDDMTFSEAFAAARAEVGAGGCFEWHGSIYGTYTAAEWNSMSAGERAEWGEHFSWNHIDHSESDVAPHSPAAHRDELAATDAAGEGDDIPVVSVDHNDQPREVAQEQSAVQQSSGETDGQDVQIIGVVHDDDSDMNIAGMVVDNQEVILIDVDNDLEFDYLAVDANGNNQLDEGEIVDIQSQHITVNDMGGFSDPAASSYADAPAPDYSDSSAFDGTYEV